MQLHQIKTTNKKKTRKRIGRGGKRGSFSGKGMNGQNSRSGNNREPIIRGIIKRYPKLRGYRFNSHNTNGVVINLLDLEKNFKAGETVSPKSLLDRKMIDKENGRLPRVKILGQGDVSKALNVKDCLLSQKSIEKIKKAGGSISIKKSTKSTKSTKKSKKSSK